jgi:DNA gyrase subunit A
MVSLALVDDTDELMMVTDKGILIRTDIGGINIISRNTQGVKLINLGAGEKLIGIARLFDENGDTDDLDSEIQADDGDSLQ